MRLVDLIGFLNGRVRIFLKHTVVLDFFMYDDSDIVFESGNRDTLDYLCWTQHAYIDSVFAIGRKIIGVSISLDEERED